MKFLLIAIGSHGDVHPLMGVGRSLVARGHSVQLAANEEFAKTVEAAGLRYVECGSAKWFGEVRSNPDVWHPRRGPAAIMSATAIALPLVYNIAKVGAEEGAFVVGSTLALGALCASEKFGFPMATVHLAPICIRSSYTMPVLPGGWNANLLPRFMRERFWAGADRYVLDPMIAPTLNAFRQSIDLPPVARVGGEWWHARRLTIGLWPEWYFPRQPDYPEQVRLADFPQYDEGDHVSLDKELVDWIGDDPPIAFTPGSAMIFGERFFEAAVGACERIGRRGLLLTRHCEHIPPGLPLSVRHVPFAPFGKLLPRCRALVHHGGIGTTAQGFAAGVPQLVMPMSHDQFDNAAIAKRLGVSDWIRPARFTAGRVAKRLKRLLDSPGVASACERVKGLADKRMFASANNANAVACDLLEKAARGESS